MRGSEQGVDLPMTESGGVTDKSWNKIRIPEGIYNIPFRRVNRKRRMWQSNTKILVKKKWKSYRCGSCSLRRGCKLRWPGQSPCGVFKTVKTISLSHDKREFQICPRYALFAGRNRQSATTSATPTINPGAAGCPTCSGSGSPCPVATPAVPGFAPVVCVPARWPSSFRRPTCGGLR